MVNENDVLFSSKEFRRILLETFRFTIDFLNSHNLRWFVGGGTCIGAIRHKGIIPWDDDIDLLMPRNDYNKLLSLRSKMEGSGYELASWNTNNTTIPFAKVIDRNTTLLETKYHPFVSGVFIDIFPMDLSNKTYEEILTEMKTYDKYIHKYISAMGMFSIKDVFNLAITCKYHFLKESIESFFTRHRKNYYLKKLQSLDKQHNCKDGNYFVWFSACYVYSYEKEILKREWFDDYIIMPFEELNVRVPIGYDSYLKHVYGDYMQLPPVEKRVTRHNHYYINLKERKSLEEIIQIKKLENANKNA